MRKFYLSLGAFALLGLSAIESNAQVQPCSHDEMAKTLETQNPEFFKAVQNEKEFLKKFIENGGGHKDGEVYIIPVVIHVVHQYGPENITDAQILNQMDILNRDFAATNADTAEVVEAFKHAYGDAKMVFRLATIDPQGNCTTGIERLVSKLTYDGGNNEARYNAWDYNKYFNIWVCDNLGGAAGYSVGYDVAMRSDYMGNIGTSGEYGSRALTHEAGHWASLPHIWGNTNPATVCGDDGIDDTPITKGFTPGSINCTSSQRVCDPNIVENHQNYMDYAYCQRMFTYGQIDAMRGRLNNPGLVHVKLWQEGNLAATGTDGITNKYCAPVASFYSNKDVACLNVPVTFRDNSTTGLVESRVWTFQDADIASSTDIAPVVRFTSAGWKTVTLVVTNAHGSDTETKTKAIFVSNASVAEAVPYLETFNDGAVIGEKWLVKNYEENQTFFSHSSTIGYSDTKSVKLNGYNSAGGKTLKNGNGDVDALITPAFNMAGAKDWMVSFKLVSATRTTNGTAMTEKLKIEYSSNCGTSWVSLGEYTKAQLSTAGYNNGNFAPANQNTWKEVMIPVTNALAKDNMRFRFTYTSSTYSNNLYIDDFKIAPSNGIEQNLAQHANVQVFPNPLTEGSELNYVVTENTEAAISITDITGKVVVSQSLGNQGIGEQSVPLQSYTSKLRSGVYLLTLQLGNSSVTKKIIIG